MANTYYNHKTLSQCHTAMVRPIKMHNCFPNGCMAMEMSKVIALSVIHFFSENIVHFDSCTKTVLTQEIILRPATRFSTMNSLLFAGLSQSTMGFSPTVLYSGIQAAEMHSCFLDTSVAKKCSKRPLSPVRLLSRSIMHFYGTLDSRHTSRPLTTSVRPDDHPPMRRLTRSLGRTSSSGGRPLLSNHFCPVTGVE